MKFNSILLFLIFMGLFATSCDTTPSESNVDTDIQKDVVDTIKGQATKVLVDENKKIQDSLRRVRYAIAKKEKPTDEQKETGMKICDCMNKIKLFKGLVKAKSQDEFNKVAGENAYGDVLAIQNCHNTIMPAVVKKFDSIEDAGIYAYKSRKYLEEKCMNSNSQLWFYIGKYISIFREDEK